MLNKQLNMSDCIENKLVVDTLNDIDTLYPDYFAKELACRRWEYGWLLSNIFNIIDYRPCKWLDVGTGMSAIPFYLASKGIDVNVIEDESYRDIIFNSPAYKGEIKFDAFKDETLPYESNSFDVVTSISVVEHIIDDSNSISECARVLKPGGVFALTTDVAPIANYTNNIRAGHHGELHWHWYDLAFFKRKIIDVGVANGLVMLDNTQYDIDYTIGIPGAAPYMKDLVIVSLFMQKI